ncbi:MAG: VWA domain-containing protein [Alphaproteobacteria bacterium]|nr:VWA domain-containing protein [Alphaproteobacteria bacterium]
MHFARVLRGAGLPIGPGKVIDAVQAVEVAGIRSRADLYWALHAVFVNRRDQRELFDQAFHVFWRNPDLLRQMLAVLMPQGLGGEAERGEAANRRVMDALFGNRQRQRGDADSPDRPSDELQFDMAMTYSDREVLQKTDFEAMTAEEVALAKKVIAGMKLPIMQVRTRRFAPLAGGPRIDMRRTLRAALRSGTGSILLARRAPKRRHPPLVVLCDISGSMSKYSRMFLHFMHAITNDRDRVHTFLFGTRLSNITRHLRLRDVDQSLARVTEAVEDWSGGTQIGACLRDFNRRWARRVLGQGAIVLFISDGLDRAAGEGLEAEIERLHKSCRRLIWLNPLLRYEQFQPKSLGVKAILPHVDDFRPLYNLESLADLAQAFGREGPRREEGMKRYLEAAP